MILHCKSLNERRLKQAASTALLSCLLVTASGAVAENLVRNGDFKAHTYVGEKGTGYVFDGWNSWMGVVNSAKGFSGRYCGDLYCPGDFNVNFACLGPVNPWGSQSIQQVLPPLQPNTKYRLSTVAAGDGFGNSYVGADLLFSIKDADNYNTVQSAESYTFDSGNFLEWKLKRQTIPIEAAWTADLIQALATPYSVEFSTPPDYTPEPARLDISVSTEGMCITDVRLEAIGPAENARIAVNSHGYIAGAGIKKTATLVNIPSYARYEWRLVYENDVVWQDNQPISDNLPSSNSLDPDSGDMVATVDFSHYAGVGDEDSFAIEVVDTYSNGVVARSASFGITKDPYESLKHESLYSFYLQRSGTAVEPLWPLEVGYEWYDLPFLEYSRQAAHSPDLAECFSGVDLHGNDWGGCTGGALDVSGGWYDAADHGKYVVNAGITVWTLQNMVERLQKKGELNAAFPDGMLRYPESAGPEGETWEDYYYKRNGISDVLDEIAHEIEFMLSMQAPAGTLADVPYGYQDTIAPSHPVELDENGDPIPVPREDIPGYGVYQVYETKSDFNGLLLHDYLGDNTQKAVINYGAGTIPRLEVKLDISRGKDVGGLVFHAVHDKSWTGIPLDPTEDMQERVLMYPTSAATLNLAAVGAQCYRVWEPIDGGGENTLSNRCLEAAIAAWRAAKKLYDAKEDVFRYEFSNRNWAQADDSYEPTTDIAYNQECSIFAPGAENCELLRNGFAVSPMFGGGGAYGDLRVNDEYYWAGIELYLATKDHPVYQADSETYLADALDIINVRNEGTTYENQYGEYGECISPADGRMIPLDNNGQEMPLQCYDWISGFDWQNVSPLGTLSALTAEPERFAIGNEYSARSNLMEYADVLVNFVNQQGYQFAKPPFDAGDRNTHYGWGANSNVLNNAIVLATAAELSSGLKAQEYRDAVIQSMDYLMGKNTHASSFVSGYGERTFTNPHHRVYANHADADWPELPSGFLSGGPNSRDIPALLANAYRDAEGTVQDTSGAFFTEVIAPACAYGKEAPQRCHHDDWRSFATNEIAINWQAPLLWISQYLTDVEAADTPLSNMRIAATVPLKTASNRAPLAKATASSSYCPNGTGERSAHCYGPDRVNDGDISTALGGNYSWANAGGALPQWVQLKWPNAETVAEVVVYTTARYPMRDFDVQYWTGSQWRNIAGVTGNRDAKRHFRLNTPVTTDRIRILGRRGPNHQWSYVRVNEVVVKGF